MASSDTDAAGNHSKGDFANLLGVTPRAALFLPVFVVMSAVGCDSASVYEDCTREPQNSGTERCFPSTFNTEDPGARQSAGIVSMDLERQENVRVAMNDDVTTTDVGGFYRFPNTPFRYDVSARLEKDVIAFNSVANRFMDLAVERKGPMRAYVAKVALTVPVAPRPGNTLAFFATGEDVIDVSGTIETGLEVQTRQFDNDKVVLHVVEYPIDKGLAGAVAKGRSRIRVRAGEIMSAVVPLEPVLETKVSMFRANPEPPPGFVLEELDILLDFGSRLSQRFVTKVPYDTKFGLPMMKGAGWTVRGKATRSDGAIASIGLRLFTPGDTTDLALYTPPAAERNEGTTLFARSAQGKGVFEHVLTPAPGSADDRIIHVISATQAAHVPDLTRLDLPPAKGEYTWTVRVFPDYTFVDEVSGIDRRLFTSSSTSAPKTIVLP